MNNSNGLKESTSEILQSADGTAWQPEYRSCPICSSDKRKRLGARGGRFQRESKGVQTDIVQCLVCKTLYAYPTLIPSSNPYEKQTADEYFKNHKAENKIASGERIAAFAESVLGRAGKILELGCGRGELLVGAARRGWTAYGVEMTERYTELARSNGIAVELSSVEECQYLNEKYDLILLAAILEHLYSPIEVLRRVYDALNPGGLVFIDVPNESSLTMRAGNLFMQACGRDSVVNLSPTFAPFHVVGFSPYSLTYALNSVGLRVYKMEVPRWFNPIFQSNSLKRKAERFAFEVVQSLGAKFGMGDGIVCWATRDNGTDGQG